MELDAPFWALISLVLFFAVIVYMKVPKTIAGSLDKRADAIRNELDQAQKLRAEAEALLAEYQKKASAAEWGRLALKYADAKPAPGTAVETAGDLAVAAALASSVFDREVPGDAVFLGEVGLGGELRAVGQVERRLSEAARMGFRKAYLPGRAVPPRAPSGIELVPVDGVGPLMERLFK